jgi:hypothetical protein
MTERKKIKIQKGTEGCKNLLEMLRKMNNLNTSEIDKIDFQQAITFIFENLKSKETRKEAFQILSELCRISFSNVQLIFKDKSLSSSCFNALFEILKTEIFDHSNLVSSGVPMLNDSESVISKYLEFYPKSHLNRAGFREIMAILIENSISRGTIISSILEKFEKYKDLISRIAKLIDYENIQEDMYIELFLNCQYARDFVELRYVRGKKRFLFVEKLVEVNLDFALQNYIRDRDKKIRMLLAKMILQSLDTYLSESYFNLLLNDPDEDIRIFLISGLNWRLGLEAVAERVLDKSLRVRTAAFELYKKGILFIKNFPKLHVFDKNPSDQNIINGKLNFSNEISLNDKEQEEHLILFNYFVEKLCLGCHTGFSSEYLQALSESGFSLDYLSEHESNPGIHIFLNSLTIVNLDTVKIHLQPLVLRHMYKGTLNHNQILNCISADIFDALKFIPNPSNYYSELLEKAISSTDLISVERIVEVLKPILNTKSLIHPIKSNEPSESTFINESGIFSKDILSANPTSFESPNLYFINAHTQTSDLFNEQQIVNIDYPSLYFQVYKLKNDPRVLKNIKKSQISIDMKIRLLLYLNNPTVIEEFASDLISYSLDSSLEKLILEKKNLTSALIYFLCTGFVSISNSSFFVKCIKCCLKIKNENKIHSVFSNYVKAVPQKTFDAFYSICYVLKGCSIRDMKAPASVANVIEENPVTQLPICDESLIMNPLITESINLENQKENMEVKNDYIVDKETATIAPSTLLPLGLNSNLLVENNMDNDNSVVNKENLNHENLNEQVTNQNNKTSQKEKINLVLTQEDKNLHSICNFIISQRPGELIPIQFDPTKYGFFKLSDLQYELIGHGQVKYQ